MTILHSADVQTLRAVAHAAFPLNLPPAARFRGTSDLEVARLLRAMDNGTQIVQSGRYAWEAHPALPRPFTKLRTGMVVAELIRTGLAIGISEDTGPHTKRIRAIPALVHFRDGARPLCPAPIRPRYRLVEIPEAVDCPMCRPLLVSKVW